MPSYCSLLLVYRTVRMRLFNYNYYSLLVAVFTTVKTAVYNCKRKRKKNQENRISKSLSLSFFF